jgi:hypothetical protein
VSKLDERRGTTGIVGSELLVSIAGTGGRGFKVFGDGRILGESADGGTARSKPCKRRREDERGPSKIVGRLLCLDVANTIMLTALSSF